MAFSKSRLPEPYNRSKARISTAIWTIVAHTFKAGCHRQERKQESTPAADIDEATYAKESSERLKIERLVRQSDEICRIFFVMRKNGILCKSYFTCNHSSFVCDSCNIDGSRRTVAGGRRRGRNVGCQPRGADHRQCRCEGAEKYRQQECRQTEMTERPARIR